MMTRCPFWNNYKEMGFDGVEMPFFDLSLDKWWSWAKRLDDLGLEKTEIIEPEYSIYGSEPCKPFSRIYRKKYRLKDLIQKIL
jgi:hypothetical protein